MVYKVENGERIATITLDGSECAVKFGGTFNAFEVKNNGSAPVLMALYSGASVGNDGAVSVPEGGAYCYAHMRQLDTVYIKGSGEVVVVAKNDTELSFAGTSGGGGHGVTVDGALSDTSKNPVQNKAVKAAIDEKANISNVINDNLLINPDFLINQRDISGTFSETGKYFADRWRLENGSVTINSDGTLTLNGTIVQVFENAVSTNVTASSDGGTASYDNSTKAFSITGSGDVIRWAKLEYGDTATAFIPPDPATELLKCRRYYQRYISTDMPYATFISSGVHIINKDIPNMRVYPTVKIHFIWGEDPTLTDANNAPHNATFSASDYRSTNLLSIVVKSDIASGAAYIPDWSNSYCELDSEIY